MPTSLHTEHYIQEQLSDARKKLKDAEEGKQAVELANASLQQQLQDPITHLSSELKVLATLLLPIHLQQAICIHLQSISSYWLI